MSRRPAMRTLALAAAWTRVRRAKRVVSTPVLLFALQVLVRTRGSAVPGLVAWLVDAAMVCGAIDRLVGARGTASGRIDNLTQSTGKGGHFVARVPAAQSPAGFTPCLGEASWKQRAVGGPVRLGVVDGPPGRIIFGDRREREGRHHGG